MCLQYCENTSFNYLQSVTLWGRENRILFTVNVCKIIYTTLRIFSIYCFVRLSVVHASISLDLDMFAFFFNFNRISGFISCLFYASLLLNVLMYFILH